MLDFLCIVYILPINTRILFAENAEFKRDASVNHGIHHQGEAGNRQPVERTSLQSADICGQTAGTTRAA